MMRFNWLLFAALILSVLWIPALAEEPARPANYVAQGAVPDAGVKQHEMAAMLAEHESMMAAHQQELLQQHQETPLGLDEQHTDFDAKGAHSDLIGGFGLGFGYPAIGLGYFPLALAYPAYGYGLGYGYPYGYGGFGLGYGGFGFGRFGRFGGFGFRRGFGLGRRF